MRMKTIKTIKITILIIKNIMVIVSAILFIIERKKKEKWIVTGTLDDLPKTSWLNMMKD